VAVPAIFGAVGFVAAKIFKARSEKMHRHLPCAMALQIIEIPHDLAAAHACGAGRTQRIINLNN
jgi:hypothetical protein